MAKVIKYNLCTVIPHSREITQGDGETQAAIETWTEEVFTPVTLPWSEANEKIAQREAHNGEYTIVDDGRVKSTAEQIAELKAQLSATDYKVIKCAECQLLGQKMPYDVEALHAQRQAIRDQINQLEQGV